MDEAFGRAAPFSGKVTESILLRGIRADAARGQLRKKIAAAVAGVLSLIPAVTSWIRGQNVAAHHFVLVVLCILYVLYSDRRLKTTARKAFAASQQEEILYSGTVTEEGVEISSAQESTKIPWGEARKTLIQPDIVLLYSAGGFHMLPRELFASEADWETCVNLTRSKVASPHEPVLTPALRSLLLWSAVFLVLVVLWWVLVTRRPPI